MGAAITVWSTTLQLATMANPYRRSDADSKHLAAATAKQHRLVHVHDDDVLATAVDHHVTNTGGTTRTWRARGLDLGICFPLLAIRVVLLASDLPGEGAQSS